jgi:Cys-rich protein (TIGR01571 family)
LNLSLGCFACWCPCISHAQTKKRLRHLNEKGFPDPLPNEITIKDCLLDALLAVTCEMDWILQVRFFTPYIINSRLPSFFFCFFFLTSVLNTSVFFRAQINTRKNIRERYNIQGSAVSDCCVPLFCQTCGLVQTSREVQAEENSFLARQVSA